MDRNPSQLHKAMCEFEKNILKLLIEEAAHLRLLQKEGANLPYMKSLDVGIQKAKEKLAQCEEKQCMKEVYKQKEILPEMSLKFWANHFSALQQCQTLK